MHTPRWTGVTVAVAVAKCANPIGHGLLPNDQDSEGRLPHVGKVRFQYGKVRLQYGVIIFVIETVLRYLR